MNEMNIYTLNGEQYEVADKKAREANAATNDTLKKKSDISYVNQTFAPAIPITLAGAAISTDMVSPVEHRVHCKISGVPDLTAVTVSRYGKNIARTIKVAKNTTYQSQKFPVQKGVTYTFSINVPVPPEGDGLSFLNTEEPGEPVAEPGISIGRGVTKLTYTPSKSYIGRVYAYTSAKWPDNIKLQVEIGSIATEYEPYKEIMELSPNTDGTVSGMTSISPNMTILTDNPNVTVETTYNADTKKYIDKKFEALQAAILSTGGNV